MPEGTIEDLLRYAATPEEMQEAIDQEEPAPPVDTLEGIIEMTDKDPMGISPRANGFVLIGACPNGDPIAIDVADEPGSVWYIGHETMSSEPLREVSIRVAGDLTEMLSGMAEGTFPYDSYEAKERLRPPGS